MNQVSADTGFRIAGVPKIGETAAREIIQQRIVLIMLRKHKATRRSQRRTCRTFQKSAPLKRQVLDRMHWISLVRGAPCYGVTP